MQTSSLDHLAGGLDLDPNTFMPDVWECLIERYAIKSVIDIGCARGAAMSWFADRGIKVRGIDGHPRFESITHIPGRFVLHDYTKGPYELHPMDEFDLAWSSEFVEHVEERFIPNFMISFAKSKHACITHALPGQGGAHHVNERTTEYWIGVFAANGFRLDREATRHLRSLGKATPYGRQTLTMFHRYD